MARAQILLLLAFLVVVSVAGVAYAAPSEAPDSEGSSASPSGAPEGSASEGPGGAAGAEGPGGAAGAEGPGGAAAEGPGGAASGACHDNVPVIAGVTAAVVAGYVF